MKNFALMSAIALTGAVGFTACSSSEDATADVNPTFDGNSVRTDFAFNISKASNGATRMTADNVQEGSPVTFLGMKDMFLLPFSAVPAAGSSTNYTEGSVRNYALGELSGLSDNQSSKVYSLTIPVGTNNFLFYGRAAGDASSDASRPGANFQKGKVDWSSLTNATGAIDNISFGLTSIANTLGDDATHIAAYLNAIAGASYTDGTTAKTWAGTVADAGTDGNYAGLAQMYTKFTTNISQYAGSTESVTRLVLDIYRTAYAIHAQSSITMVQNIAEEICKAIETPVNGVNLSVVNGNTAITLAGNADVTTAESWTATLNGVVDNFPANLNLPMGAAQLVWESNQFKYKVDASSNPSTHLGTTSVKLADYRYPSELIFFDNSPLRATSSYKKADEYPKTVSTWDNLFQGTTWEQERVEATTRAVAMTNNVNYGVSMLVSNVKLTSAAMTDNQMHIISGSAANQTITAVADGNKDIATKKSVFKVTGILVGGQPATVGWNMVPQSTATFESVIYDKDVTYNTTALSTTATSNNYTLVFDNFKSGTQDNVTIALEIVNDGCDFYGAEGLIPAGSTFYLLGTLDLTSKTLTTATRKSTYRVTNESTTRVFVQDYKTTANITIGADGLSKAYSAIPDLRATEVLFGLSVDLNWVPGLTFDVTM